MRIVSSAADTGAVVVFGGARVTRRS